MYNIMRKKTNQNCWRSDALVRNTAVGKEITQSQFYKRVVSADSAKLSLTRQNRRVNWLIRELTVTWQLNCNCKTDSKTGTAVDSLRIIIICRSYWCTKVVLTMYLQCGSGYEDVFNSQVRYCDRWCSLDMLDYWTVVHGLIVSAQSLDQLELFRS